MKKIFGALFHYLGLPFVCIALCWSLFRAKSKAKKYRKDSKSIFIQDRFKFVYKICKKILFVKNVKVKAIDFESIPTNPKLFIGNHKSNIDAIVMIKVLYENLSGQYFTFICKKELSENKFVKAVIDLIDGIFIDRNDPRQIFEILKKQKELIKNNYSLIVFPEGTRTFSDDIGEFKSGALRIAYDCFLPIVCFTIYGSSGRMDKNKSNKIKGEVRVKINNCYRPKEFITTNVINLASKLRNIVMNAYQQLKEESSKKEKK